MPLYEGIKSRCEPVVELLWSHGARLTQGMDGDFLCRAVDDSSIETLRDLLKYGANINATNIDGSTALHTAITASNVELARFLISCGANLDKTDARGLTPLDLARQQRQEDMVVLCLEKQCFSHEANKLTITNSDSAIIPSSIIKKTDLTQRTPQRNVQVVPYYENSSMKMLPSRSQVKERHVIMSSSRGQNPIRAIIHQYHPEGRAHKRQIGKLINLPESLEDIFQLASKYMHVCVIFPFWNMYLSMFSRFSVIIWTCLHETRARVQVFSSKDIE